MKKKVLVAEDNAINMRLFSDLLRIIDVDIIPVIDGNEVLGKVYEHCPDLILMDISLPNISGLELIRSLRQDISYKDTPIIAVTAQEKNACYEAGCTDYMPKPISIPEFVKKVRYFV